MWLYNKDKRQFLCYFRYNGKKIYPVEQFKTNEIKLPYDETLEELLKQWIELSKAKEIEIKKG